LSDVHRLECLVGPLVLGDAATLAERILCGPTVMMLPITAAVFERAARIRAVHGFRPLESLHLAAAAECGCGTFLTNDTQPRFPDVTVEILS
jgi:hypothetical protein